MLGVVNGESGDGQTLEELLSEQVEYYRARAPEYDADDLPPGALMRRELIDDLLPTGDCLELACGTGQWTQEIVRHADSLTAVDASPEALSICKKRIDTESVRYVQEDIFTWEPDRLYDTVFFAFWLSHVPLAWFGEFWSLVGRCLKPHGRVLFVDEDHRSRFDKRIEGRGVVRRTVLDGREFRIVKVLWREEELAARLKMLGWTVDVQPLGEFLLVGEGYRQAA